MSDNKKVKTYKLTPELVTGNWKSGEAQMKINLAKVIEENNEIIDRVIREEYYKEGGCWHDYFNILPEDKKNATYMCGHCEDEVEGLKTNGRVLLPTNPSYQTSEGRDKILEWVLKNEGIEFTRYLLEKKFGVYKEANGQLARQDPFKIYYDIIFLITNTEKLATTLAEFLKEESSNDN